MPIKGLGDVPGETVKAWLKGKKLTHSGKITERIDKLLAENKLSISDVDRFIDEQKNCGNKHVYLYCLNKDDKITLKSPAKAAEYWHRFAGSKNNTLNQLGMSFDQCGYTANEFWVRISKSIEIIEYRKHVESQHDGKYWIQKVAVQKKVYIIIVIKFDTNLIEIRFDSVKELGKSKKEIIQHAHRVLLDSRLITEVNRFSLHNVAQNVGIKGAGAVIEATSKLETEDGNGRRRTATTRLTSDDLDACSIEHFPIGEEMLAQANPDEFLNKCNIQWINEVSGGNLTRVVKTEINPLTGEIYFFANVTKSELEYVLSCIRKVAH